MDDGFMPNTYNNNAGGTGSVNPGTAADNYNSVVQYDDGSCLYTGCTDPTANNYDSWANVDNGSCTYTP